MLIVLRGLVRRVVCSMTDLRFNGWTEDDCVCRADKSTAL